MSRSDLCQPFVVHVDRATTQREVGSEGDGIGGTGLQNSNLLALANVKVVLDGGNRGNSAGFGKVASINIAQAEVTDQALLA